MSVPRQVTYPSGAVIFREGEKPESPCMYDLLSGAVNIYANYGTANQTLLVTVDPDSDVCFFGEMGLVEDAARSATAVAAAETTLCVITPKDLQSYMEGRPMMILRIMQQMSGRLRDLTDRYMEACHVIAQQNEDSAEAHEPTTSEKIKEYIAFWDECMSDPSVIKAQQSSGYYWDSAWVNRWY